MNCPLCLNNNIQHYHRDKQRDYWQCGHCDLVFVKPEQFLSLQQEKSIYDQHQNNPDDLGYRKFLNKLLLPLAKQLIKQAKGLDFGSGPGPAISVILAEQGYQVENFDVFYADDRKLLTGKYDFITCTEVIEHLHSPHKELAMLTGLLNSGGFLGVMTKRLLDKASFTTWHYKNDLTHVCFYSDQTFEYIAKTWQYKTDIINSDTVILRKI